jgi:methionyl-tRNA formyltransferase
MALTFLCGQRYRPALLDALSYSANYHNGALPNYRGVYATNWSIYQNEPTTGFTFHRMDAKLDEGPILLAGEVPISADANLWEVEHEKTLAAAGCVPQVLAMMVQRAPGTPQVGEGRYFSGLACRRMRTIPDPRALSGEELQRRARAFAALTLPVRGRWCKAARLVEVPGNGDIESADGRYFRAGYRKACPPPAGL